MTESTDAAFDLLIRLSNGQRIQVTMPGEGGAPAESSSITVLKVKESIALKDSTAPADRQKLIFKGRILDNDRTLSDYGIVKGSTLFMVKSAAPASSNPPSNPTPTPSTNPTGPSARRPSDPGPPPMMPGRFPGNQQQGMGMGMPNPEQMQAMLNSPHMQGLLDNPDLLGSMLEHSMQSPQMQELMRNNPELRQLYQDPAMIQQAIAMMRNPQHMQQVMRQQDLAMANLENMPGGFAALSNMYRNVQEPMMEAQQASRRGDDTTQANRNSSGSADGATGAAMPNPWGSPAPAPSPRNSATNNNNPAAAMFPGGMPNPWGAAAGGGAGGMPNPWAGPAGAGAAGGMPNPWGAAPGAGGGGGMPGMPAGMPPPNMDQMMQMLDNPMMTQMMENMVQNNPDMIRTMLEAQNPMLRQMFQGNPEAANNFIRQMFNPQTMRQMMEMQRSMGGMPGMMPGGGVGGFPPMMGGMPFGMPPAAGAGGSPAGANPGIPGGGDLDFSNLIQQFQQSGIGGAAAFAGPPAQVPPTNPAERYRVQLQSLAGMGFEEEQALSALVANHGNLNRAVDQLLSAPPPASPPASPPAAAAASPDAAAGASNQDASSSETDAATPKEDSGDKKQ